MLFNIIFKQYLNIFIRNFVLCIQIRFVSTEKTTRIASRASCSFSILFDNETVIVGKNREKRAFNVSLRLLRCEIARCIDEAHLANTHDEKVHVHVS